MPDYSILVKNKSGEPHAYFLFVESPDVSSGGDTKVYQNVYIAAPTTPSGTGTANFAIHKDTFAVTGTNPGQALGSNVTVTTGDYGVAKLAQASKPGSSFAMTAGDGKAAMFDPNLLKQATTQPGAFSIACDNSFKWGNGSNQFIGLGAQDPSDPTNIVPVAVFLARPGTNNIIVPKSKYYISWGTYVSGQIIDVTTVATPCLVDFTGKAATLAKVEHSADGTWAVTFN